MKKICVIVLLGMVFCSGSLSPKLFSGKKTPESVKEEYEKGLTRWEEYKAKYEEEKINTLKEKIQKKEDELKEAEQNALEKESTMFVDAPEDSSKRKALKKEFLKMHNDIQKIRKELGQLHCDWEKAKYEMYASRTRFGVKIGKGEYNSFLEKKADYLIEHTPHG